MFQPHLHAGALAGAVTGTPIDLEPVNLGADQVTNTVEAAARQSWWGFGWGLGIPSENILNNVKAYTSQLFTELGTTVLRFNDPSSTSTIPIGKPIVDEGKFRGVDTVLATGYWARARQSQANAGDTPTYTPTDLANAIHAAMNPGGMLITHADLQNEPDGHADNSLNEPGGAVYDMRAKYTEFRNRLNFHGHNTNGTSPVWIIGCEWAHFGGGSQPKNPFTDHDEMNAASPTSLIPGTLAFGAGHCYSDCPTPGDYDQRWMLRSKESNSPFGSNGLWSTETGNFGAADSLGGSVATTGEPHPGARMIAALNHGSVVEVAHIGVPRVTEIPTATNSFQCLIQADGRRHPWHAQCAGRLRSASSSPTRPRSRVFRCSGG